MLTLDPSEVKGPVMDRPHKSHFLDQRTGQVFLSQFDAFTTRRTPDTPVPALNAA